MDKKEAFTLNVRSKNLKIRNLPKQCKRIGQINSKPYVFLVLFFILGILLIACRSYVMGTILTVLFIYNLCFVKNCVLIEFYEDHAVFYQITTHKDDCYLLFWDDIEKWRYVKTKTDYDLLEITLKNGKEISLKCISKHKTLHCFKRFVKVPQTAKTIRRIL